MRKKSFCIVFIFLTAIQLFANEQDNLKFQIQSIKREISPGKKNDICLQLKSRDDSTTILLDDFTAIYLIEYSHKLLFSDFIDKELPLIEVAFKNITTTQKQVNGQEETFITAMEKINPNAANSDYFYDYQSLNPGIPEADFHHRYVTVPVDMTILNWAVLISTMSCAVTMTKPNRLSLSLPMVSEPFHRSAWQMITRRCSVWITTPSPMSTGACTPRQYRN